MRLYRRSLARQASAAALLMFAVKCADAHGVVKEVGDFYAGALHPLTALEHVLPFVAFGIFVGQRGQKATAALLVFSLMLMIGAASALWMSPLPYVSLLNILSAALLGVLVAGAWRLPIWFIQTMAVVFGFSHGFANGMAVTGSIKPYLFIPGLGVAGLIVPAWTMIVTDFLLRQRAGWMHIAVRVAGSWIAAIGILVLATSGRGLLNF